MKIGERLQSARKAAKLTLHELAAAVGVSHTAIAKYEKGQLEPNSAMLIQLSEALGVRVEFFFRTSGVDLQRLAYRKKASLRKSDEEAVLAKAKEWAERYQEVEELFPDSLPTVIHESMVQLDRQVSALDEVERVAEEFREKLGLGRDAIENMVDLLEDLGIKVTMIDADAKFDAVSFRDSEGGYVIVANQHFSWARSRYNLAHELGHILWENVELPAEIDEEKIANRFAGAFLVPREKAIRELGKRRQGLNPLELIDLKRKYGISMQAWLYRAKDLGILSETSFQQLIRQFAYRGWRRTEPDEINRVQQPEEPRRLERLVGRALAEGIVSHSRANELVGYELPHLYQEVLS